MADQKQDPPYDKDPRPLCPDRQLGTRAGWAWCSRCGAIQPPAHSHPLPSCNRHLDCDAADARYPALGAAEHCTSTACQPMCCPPACLGDPR